MIVWAEICRKDNEHAMFNVAMLNICCDVFSKEDRVVAFWDKGQFKICESYLKNSPNLTIRKIAVVRPKKSDKLSWFVKLGLEIVIMLKVLLFARLKAARILFFTSLSPFSQYILNIILKILLKKTLVIIALHGELELVKGESKKKIDKYLAFCLFRSFHSQIKNRKFLLLGHSIAKNAQRYGILTEDQIITIEHPYILPAKQLSIIHEDYTPKKLIFAHLGVAKLSKNSHLFFKLASEFRKEVKQGRVRFQIIGPVFKELQPFVNEFVDFSMNDQFLDRSSYEVLCANIDCALFFYDNKAYELCSSGALLDAIFFGKPVLGMENSYFKGLFSLIEHKPGLLFQDFHGMVLHVKRLLNKDTDLKVFQHGIIDLQKRLNLESVGKEFFDQIKNR